MMNYYKKNKLDLIVYVLILILVLFIYWRWYFNFSILTSGDWVSHDLVSLKELFNLPYVWEPGGVGSVNITSSFYPFNLLSGILATLNINYGIIERLIFMWPYSLLSFFSIYFLLKKDMTRISAFIGMLVFSLNTYFGVIVTGQLTLLVAYSIIPLTIHYFDKILLKKNFIDIVLFALLLFVCAFYEFRVFYILSWVLLFYFIYNITFINKESLKEKLILCLYVLSPFILFILTQAYWIMGLLQIGSINGNELFSRGLFGNGYLNIQEAFTLFHPFWSGSQPTIFEVQKIPLYFWLIPLIAFTGLVINIKKKKVVFYGFLALLGILLTKQVDIPFPKLYQWLYSNFPGFNAYREGSKFFFLIVLSYSFLIGFFVDTLINKKGIGLFKKCLSYTLVIIIASVFMWNSVPLINGKLNTLFKERITPESYLLLNEKISKESDFFRTYWIPRDSRWGLQTLNHPKISGVGIINSNWSNFTKSNPLLSKLQEKEKITKIIQGSSKETLFNISSIKYLVVPIEDKFNDDNFFIDYGGKEDLNIRQWYIDQFDKVSWLKKVDTGTKDLVVYENKKYKQPIFSFSKLYNFDSLQDLDDKYDFTNKLGNDFYFVSSSTNKSTEPLIKISNLFENSVLINGAVSDDVSGGSNKTKLYINLNISNLKTNLYLNNKLVSGGNVPLSYSSNVFEYKNPEYKFENIISNFSFENGLWQEKVGDCNNFDKNPLLEMSISKDSKTDGIQALQLEATRHIACTAIASNIVAGRTYQFSFDYQSPNADHAAYYLGFNDKNKTKIEEDLLIKDKNWNTFSKTIKAPDGATNVSLNVYADSTDGKTNIINRYDNFKLIEVPDLNNAYYLVSDPGVKLVEPKEIKFDLVNPTKKLVHIKGATTPFYLAMGESYHLQWQLQFNNSKVNGFFDSWIPFVKPDRIPDEYHYKLNDFLNAWYVDADQYCRNNNQCIKNADGSYDMEMVIEFFPQRWFYLGLLISGTTLLGCLGYLGYEGVKRIRIKIKKKNEKDN